MTPEEIADILKDKFGDKLTGQKFETAHPHVVVAQDAWHEVAVFLRNDERLKFDMLRCISAVDLLEDEQFEAVYDLHSTNGALNAAQNWTERHEFCVRVRVPRDKPHIDSVADVWIAADWHEREAYDLMGIVFDGHPDSVEGPQGPHPRRILCPDDWIGHPLRKDYVFPMEYNGIPAVTEHGQTRPIH